MKRVYLYLFIFPLLVGACVVDDRQVENTELPDVSTRVTMDNIVVARDMAEGDQFRLWVYRLSDDADTYPDGGFLFATADAVVNAQQTVDFTTLYSNKTKTEKNLHLPTGNYRMLAYMAPNATQEEVITDDPAKRQFTFSRGTDLLAGVKDVTIARRPDVADHTESVDWSSTVFRHQSTKINFRVEHKTPAVAADKLKNPINLRKIEVTRLVPQGIGSFSLLATDVSTALTTTPLLSEGETEVPRTATVTLEHQDNTPGYEFVYANDADDCPTVTTYPFLMIPEKSHAGLFIKITLQTELLGSRDFTLSAVSTLADYLPHTAYTFTLKIDKDRPVLECKVEPWYTGSSGNQDNDADDIEDDGHFTPGKPGFTVQGWEESPDNEQNAGEVG